MRDLAPELDLARYLETISQLGPETAAKLAAEVNAFYSESGEEFVRRRHRELKAKGVRNADIYPMIQRELEGIRVVPQPYSERQIRRIIYG